MGSDVNNQHRKPTKKRNPDAERRSARIDALALEAQSKDTTMARRATAELLKRIGPMIRNICTSWAKKNGVEYDDAFQEASIGFLRAVEMWRPEKRANFLTYVGPWIHAFARRTEMVHHLGKSVRAPHRVTENRLSLDDDRDGRSLHEMIGTEPEQLDFLETLERDTVVREAVRSLPENEREILEGRMDGLTLEQLATPRGHSRERIRQVELVAKNRVRPLLRQYSSGASVDLESRSRAVTSIDGRTTPQSRETKDRRTATRATNRLWRRSVAGVA
jgi:RNA polymerase sigma factor (sigma-70 family)